MKGFVHKRQQSRKGKESRLCDSLSTKTRDKRVSKYLKKRDVVYGRPLIILAVFWLIEKDRNKCEPSSIWYMLNPEFLKNLG